MEKGYFRGHESPNKSGRGKKADKEDSDTYREKTLRKNKKKVNRLINSNYVAGRSTFLTLTFAENMQDIDYAYYQYKKFRRNFEYYLGNRLKYVAVPEFQKRGAIHFHLALFDIGYIPVLDIKRMWSHGSVHVKQIREVEDVGQYMSKYMTKDTSEALRGRKSYFRSNGLNEPVIITDKKKIEHITSALSKNVIYDKSFSSDQAGEVHYTKYSMN